jgi:hypothetical protein
VSKWLGTAVIVLLFLIFLLTLQATEVINLVPVWHEYAHLMSDPAHTAVEFTFVLFDYLIISWVRARIIKHLHRDVRAGKHKETHGIQS